MADATVPTFSEDLAVPELEMSVDFSRKRAAEASDEEQSAKVGRLCPEGSAVYQSPLMVLPPHLNISCPPGQQGFSSRPRASRSQRRC
jgi:hypothetical protein